MSRNAPRTPKMIARIVMFKMANTSATTMTSTDAFNFQLMRCHQFNSGRSFTPRLWRIWLPSRSFFFGFGPGCCSVDGLAGEVNNLFTRCIRWAMRPAASCSDEVTLLTTAEPVGMGNPATGKLSDDTDLRGSFCSPTTGPGIDCRAITG